MEIANVDARDMGTYKAVARNASVEGHATINLTFEEGMLCTYSWAEFRPELFTNFAAVYYFSDKILTGKIEKYQRSNVAGF